jgi:uncharacterized protein (DUF1015 family)
MAEIVPIKGIYYDSEKAGALESLIGPPYDVLSPAAQDALYEQSPYNFVRVMLNRPEEGDDSDEAPYKRAANFLMEWQTTGVLTEDERPAFYAYRQEFTNPADSQRYTRTGIFCGVKLEPYSAGVVLPHEETRTKAKEDRLRLMRSTAANPEPIFGLYEDENGSLARAIDQSLENTEPFLAATVEGDDHRVWRIDDEAVGAVQRFFAHRRVWIADGHHRYETGLAYRDERRAQDGSSPDERQPYDHLLIVLTAFNDPGIVVLPTHRLVRNVTPDRMEQIHLQLERYFDVESVEPDQLAERMHADPAAGDHRFGMVTAQGAFVLTLRDVSVMEAAVEGHADVWKKLDVSILQTLVLDRSLGIPAATLATTPDIAYTRDWDEALRSVAGGEFQAAFLLNNPSATEVRDVSAAGDKMPPKSTFFYPKVWSGLIMRRV